MKTTIDNRQKVFQVVNTNNHTQVFCNLEDLNQVIKQSMTEGSFTIYLFWNNKPARIIRPQLLKMFEANGIEQEFNY